MPDIPISRSNSADVFHDALERQENTENFAQHLGTHSAQEPNPASGLQERLTALQQQAPQLQPDDLRGRMRSLQEDMEDASEHLGSGQYTNMMSDLGRLIPFRSVHDTGVQPQGLIQGSQLAMHRATVDVTRAAAAGDDVNEAVARAMQQHELSLRAADGPDGQSGLRRLGQQAATGGLVRASPHDLASAQAEVRRGQDPEQVAARSNFINPQDVAALQAARPTQTNAHPRQLGEPAWHDPSMQRAAGIAPAQAAMVRRAE